MRSTIFLFLLLAACAVVPIIHGCPSVKEWTAGEQLQMIVAEDQLKKDNPDSIILAMIQDYKRMRDEARACR